MNSVEATAPGKVVVLGEYAVLDGAPALSLAVDRRARVTIEPCRPGQCEVIADQLGMDPVAFSLRRDGVEWLDRGPEWSRFERTAGIMAHLVERALRRFGQLHPFRLHIDTAELFVETGSGPVKLGLGSSAAVSVALDAAITRFAGTGDAIEPPAAVLERLLEPYRGTQGGYGSGLDLATSLHGGLVEYRIERGHITVRPLKLPPDLEWLFVWSGQAATTGDLVAGYRRWCRQRPEDMRALFEQMQATAAAGVTAMRDGDARALARHIGAYGVIMGKMGDLADLPVVTTIHRQAMAMANRRGVAYKPCGAGGGDMGMAVSNDPEAIERLAAEYRQAGLEILALKADPNGPCVTEITRGRAGQKHS